MTIYIPIIQSAGLGLFVTFLIVFVVVRIVARVIEILPG